MFLLSQLKNTSLFLSILPIGSTSYLHCPASRGKIWKRLVAATTYASSFPGNRKRDPKTGRFFKQKRDPKTGRFLKMRTPEEIKANRKRYNEAHREQHKQYIKTVYKDYITREEVRARRRVSNPTYRAYIAQPKVRERNRASCRRYLRKWRYTHPVEQRIKNRKLTSKRWVMYAKRPIGPFDPVEMRRRR